jgi:hypothetical protein
LQAKLSGTLHENKNNLARPTNKEKGQPVYKKEPWRGVNLSGAPIFKILQQAVRVTLTA